MSDSELPRVDYDDEDGDVLRTEGPTTIHRTVEAVAQRRALVPVFFVLSGPRSAGAVLRIGAGGMLGRSMGADIQLLEEGVSRQHARVSMRPPRDVLIEDCGSTHGLHVGDERVESRTLSEGERIRVGEATLVLLWMQDPGPPLPSRRPSQRVSGILDRRELVRQLTVALQSSRRDAGIAVVLFQIEPLESLRNGGHDVQAEELFVRIARIASDVLPSEDAVLARYGDELALVLPDTGLQEAWTCAECIRCAVEGTPASSIGTPLEATVSAGIATSQPGTSVSPLRVLDDARAALYRAVLGGRNRTEPASGGPGITTQVGQH